MIVVMPIGLDREAVAAQWPNAIAMLDVFTSEIVLSIDSTEGDLWARCGESEAVWLAEEGTWSPWRQRCAPTIGGYRHGCGLQAIGHDPGDEDKNP